MPQGRCVDIRNPASCALVTRPPVLCCCRVLGRGGTPTHRPRAAIFFPSLSRRSPLLFSFCRSVLPPCSPFRTSAPSSLEALTIQGVYSRPSPLLSQTRTPVCTTSWPTSSCPSTCARRWAAPASLLALPRSRCLSCAARGFRLFQWLSVFRSCNCTGEPPHPRGTRLPDQAPVHRQRAVRRRHVRCAAAARANGQLMPLALS